MKTAQGIKLNESRQGAQLLFSERKCQVWLHLLLARGYKWNKNKPTLQPTFNCLIAAASQPLAVWLFLFESVLWGWQFGIAHPCPCTQVSWVYKMKTGSLLSWGLSMWPLQWEARNMGSFKTFTSNTRIIRSLGFYFEIANLVSFCVWVDGHFLPPALTLWWNTRSLTFELKPLLCSI